MNFQANTIAEIETYVRGLHPETEISVIEDNSFIYVEEPGLMIRNWETLRYEGKAKDYK